MKIYPLRPDPELYCVPACIALLTGQPLDAVIIPAINRAKRNSSLFDFVEGVDMRVAEYVLRELGYHCRYYKYLTVQSIATWAAKSYKYNYPLLLATMRHTVIAYNGLIYDNHSPLGSQNHAYKNYAVTYCALVQR